VRFTFLLCKSWVIKHETFVATDFNRLLVFSFRPENLLINEHGRIVIIDMGHAKRVAASGAPSPLALSRTTTTNPYGTPAFNAPEVSGGRAYDCEWADVWSVGVIAFYLHGKLPAFNAGGGVADWKDVSGPNNDLLWRKIITSGYYPVFPEELKGFINALWRLDPSERPRFSQLEKAITADDDVIREFPGLQWLARPVNEVEGFIDELSRSCPNNTFHPPGGGAKRW